MNKVPMALLLGALAMSAGALAAEKDTQAPQAPQPSTDCTKLSGKDKDKCVQATPAGPVDMHTGAQKKGKSEVAKDRDRAKQAKEAGNDKPTQSGDGVGHPADRTATGEAQSGQEAGKDTPRKTQ